MGNWRDPSDDDFSPRERSRKFDEDIPKPFGASRAMSSRLRSFLPGLLVAVLSSAAIGFSWGLWSRDLRNYEETVSRLSSEILVLKTVLDGINDRCTLPKRATTAYTLCEDINKIEKLHSRQP